jgi:hypothetical protein
MKLKNNYRLQDLKSCSNCQHSFQSTAYSHYGIYCGLDKKEYLNREGNILSDLEVEATSICDNYKRKDGINVAKMSSL